MIKKPINYLGQAKRCVIKMQVRAVRGGIFGHFFFEGFDICQMEVAGDVIFSVAEDQAAG